MPCVRRSGNKHLAQIACEGSVGKSTVPANRSRQVEPLAALGSRPSRPKMAPPLPTYLYHHHSPASYAGSRLTSQCSMTNLASCCFGPKCRTPSGTNNNNEHEKRRTIILLSRPQSRLAPETHLNAAISGTPRHRSTASASSDPLAPTPTAVFPLPSLELPLSTARRQEAAARISSASPSRPVLRRMRSKTDSRCVAICRQVESDGWGVTFSADGRMRSTRYMACGLCEVMGAEAGSFKTGRPYGVCCVTRSARLPKFLTLRPAFGKPLPCAWKSTNTGRCPHERKAVAVAPKKPQKHRKIDIKSHCNVPIRRKHNTNDNANNKDSKTPQVGNAGIIHWNH